MCTIPPLPSAGERPCSNCWRFSSSLRERAWGQTSAGEGEESYFLFIMTSLWSWQTNPSPQTMAFEVTDQQEPKVCCVVACNITITLIREQLQWQWSLHSLLCFFYRLSDNPISDEGCAALSRGLQECRELQKLEWVWWIHCSESYQQVVIQYRL